MTPRIEAAIIMAFFLAGILRRRLPAFFFARPLAETVTLLSERDSEALVLLRPAVLLVGLDTG